MKLIALFCLFCCLATSNVFGSYCTNAKRGLKTSAMISRYLVDLADNSSGFAAVKTLGTSDGANNGQGRSIAAILITENADWENDNGKPTVIITGAIHGNEWATPEVCLGIAEYLLENKDNEESARDDKGLLINKEAGNLSGGIVEKNIAPGMSSIKRLLGTIQIIIIPVFNPEGYDYSQTPEGGKSYYGSGWRPNRCNQKAFASEEICYRQDGSQYDSPPTNAEHCFLADYDDTASGGDLEEETLIVCESVDKKTIQLFKPDLSVATLEMFDALYNSPDSERVVCASGNRRIWKDEWTSENEEPVDLTRAKQDGYLQDAFGVDLNRNFQYKWDVVEKQKHLFIRTRSPSSRMYRGTGIISEKETLIMEKLVAGLNVTALIDYHAGSTQVLYPFAYSTEVKVDRNILGGKSDYQVFRQASEKIASLLNRHDRGDKSIINYTAAQNYNNTSVGSGVARDCYYETEGIAAINIEVHDRQYTYEETDFIKTVPAICKVNVPGAIWFLFWAADLPGNRLGMQ